MTKIISFFILSVDPENKQFIDQILKVLYEHDDIIEYSEHQTDQKKFNGILKVIENNEANDEH